VWESSGVSQEAIAQGIARQPIERSAHREHLAVRLGTGREIVRGLMLRARQEKFRVVYTEGTNETILRASRIVREEGVAVRSCLERRRHQEKAEKLAWTLAASRSSIRIEALDSKRMPKSIFACAAAAASSALRRMTVCVTGLLRVYDGVDG